MSPVCVEQQGLVRHAAVLQAVGFPLPPPAIDLSWTADVSSRRSDGALALNGIAAMAAADALLPDWGGASGVTAHVAGTQSSGGGTAARSQDAALRRHLDALLDAIPEPLEELQLSSTAAVDAMYLPLHQGTCRHHALKHRPLLCLVHLPFPPHAAMLCVLALVLASAAA